MRIRTGMLAATMVLALAASAHANLIDNPGFLFTTANHTNGDNGLHISSTPGTTTPSWSSSTATPGYNSDPQSIFAFTSEYIQVQYNGTPNTRDLYQQVTATTGGTGTLMLDVAHRNDLLNDENGNLFIELYAGHLTSFGSATPITPTTGAAALAAFNLSTSTTTTVQTITFTYEGLAAGAYTVRLGGTRTANATYQDGFDNAFFEVVADIPSPAALPAGLAMIGLAAARRRR